MQEELSRDCNISVSWTNMSHKSRKSFKVYVYIFFFFFPHLADAFFQCDLEVRQDTIQAHRLTVEKLRLQLSASPGIWTHKPLRHLSKEPLSFHCQCTSKSQPFYALGLIDISKRSMNSHW